MSAKKILIRFDDICPTMDWKQWECAKRMMDHHGLKALLGVIPDCQDPELSIDEPKEDFWEYIRELQSQGWAIAMHGYHHVYDIKADGIVTRNKNSEFAGHPYEVQLERIRNGQAAMRSHGIETDIFFAPAHNYDDNTLKALSVCGFKYVSDGFSGKPYKRHGIILLPCRNKGIPRMDRKDEYVTAVIHPHEWTREDKKHEFVRFQNLLQDFHSAIVPFQEYINRKCGNNFLQRSIEYLYGIAIFKILPLRNK